MRPMIALRALGITVCAQLIFAMVACGGGGGSSSYTGGNSGGSGSGGSGGGVTAPPALVINSSTLPSGLVGMPYSQTLSASGGTPPYTWTAVYGTPSGFSFSSSGVLTATSTPQQGRWGMTVQVTDSGSPQQTAVQQIIFGIYPKLVFLTTSLPNAHLGAPYQQLLGADGLVDINSWRIVSGQLPPGLQLGSSPWINVITGTPTQTGTFSFTIQVQDTSTPPQVAQQALTLIVDNGLAVVTRNLGSGLQNASYSATVTAVGGTPPYQWSAVGLPAGLTIDVNTGIISGMPSAWGSYQPTVTVSDAAGNSSSQTLGLTINPALTIPNYGNQSAVVNKFFYDNLFAFGGVPPYSWSIVSGTLPPGLTLDSARGVISGIPTQLGSYNVTLQVTDTGPPQQAAQLATTFSVVPPQLYITGTVPDKWPLGVPVQWSAAIQGGTPPYQWNAASGSLPPGLNFDPNTGDVAGTPTTLGQYNFTLSATDSGSPPQTANSSFWANVTTPLGRNDTIAHATPVSDGSWLASISPYADPPDSSTPVPDTDYYKIIGSANTVVKVWTGAQSIWWNTPVDTVLEIVDTNGVRLNTCRLPGDPSFYYNSPCLNDDIAQGTYRDSQLEVKLPGQGNTLTTFYAHVFDWRGDARPDMQYYLNVSGSIQPLQAQPAGFAYFGQGQQSKTGCVVNLACYIQFQATGGLQPLTWSIASGNIPPGMAMDPQFGAVKGTPAVTGTYSFAAQASDASSPPQTVDIPFKLTVEPPVAILTTSLPNGTVGQSYSFTLNGTGGTPPLTWQAGAPDYNFTLQMNGSTGVLSGIPRVAGTFPVNVIATDSVGVYAFASFPFTALPGPLTFTGGSYGNGKVGIQYADATPYLNAYGGALPISISLIGGTVPPGLSFNGGELKGIPTTAGTYSLQLQATDSSSPTPQTQTATYTITITP